MKFIMPYIKKYYKLFLVAVLCVFIEVTCDLLQPTLLSKVIDKGIAKSDMNSVIRYGTMMVGIAFLGAIIATGRNIVSTKVAQGFGANIRSDLFNKIQRFDFEKLDKFERASLITRLTNDISNIQQFCYGLMRVYIRAPLMAIGSIIMAVRLDLKLSLVIIIIIPIVAIFMIIGIKKAYPFFVKVQGALDKVNKKIREYLMGVRAVKAFNRFDYEEESFSLVNEDLTNKSIRAMRTMAIFSPVNTFIINFGVICILVLGGLRVNSGTLEVGKVVAFTNYMTQLLFALGMITMIFNSLIRARTSWERISEVLMEDNDIKEINYNSNSDLMKGEIEFKNVIFSYNGLKGEPIIKGVSFYINHGSTVSIIGSTGSGKTTLVNLIPRFYEASSGEINIDGVNIKEYSYKELRDKIAIVPQKTVLFSGSIKENIKWGKEDATDDEIEMVAEIADVNTFIKNLKDGYDTFLEQGGVNLSGGQKQRVAIARALIKKPEILILDDSTSALDTNTEYKIRMELKEYSKYLTTIVITQKITTAMSADKIIVLDDGKIVGMGTHEELLNNSKVYQDIYKSQQ